jgi:hypothetical protein
MINGLRKKIRRFLVANRLKSAVLFCALFVFGFKADSFAEDFTLVLAGQTHAMLYHCSCPIEPDGGIARRATLIQQLRKDNPNILLVDSGSFFAGGIMDQLSQSNELDQARTLVHLKAMDLMKYDAAALSPDEFNYGRQFLEENIAKTGITFLGANIVSPKIAPYMIKKFAKFQVGVIGLVSPITGKKFQDSKFIPPQEALKKALLDLKKNNVDIIVLISGLNEEENKQLLSDNPGINILIEGAKTANAKTSDNIGSTLALAPKWEARRLVVANFSIENKALKVKKVEELRVSDKFADDEQMLSILPQCFSDKDCKKNRKIPVCVNPGKPVAQCQYKEPPPIGLTVINKPDCRTCDTVGVINALKTDLPGLSIDTLEFSGKKAQKLISELALKYIPAYLLDRSVEKDPIFEKLRPNLELRGDFYLLSPRVSIPGNFFGRQKLEDRFDLFLSLQNKDSGELLDTLKEFTPEVHFLAVEDNEGFIAPGGKPEIEEYLRAACVQKYYPGFFYSYISCRAKNQDAPEWNDCLQDVDLTEVKTCASGPEGENLLRLNIALNLELGIINGPTYLLDNQEIFSSPKVLKKEEFRKILFKR